MRPQAASAPCYQPIGSFKNDTGPLSVFSFVAAVERCNLWLFYAWVCSTMWGLDAADPMIAIGAMQAMNASVRNVVFAPTFFGTPFVLIATAMLALFCRFKIAALIFTIAGLLYLFGGMLLTAAVNVPMNEALAAVYIPHDAVEAQRIWDDYSKPWQFWNLVRTVVSGTTLALTGIAIFTLNPRTK